MSAVLAEIIKTGDRLHYLPEVNSDRLAFQVTAAEWDELVKELFPHTVSTATLVGLRVAGLRIVEALEP